MALPELEQEHSTDSPTEDQRNEALLMSNIDFDKLVQNVAAQFNLAIHGALEAVQRLTGNQTQPKS